VKPSLARVQIWLAGLWAGCTLAVGAVAAPSLFAVLSRDMAGLGAGRIFAVEARISLFVAIVLFVLERQRVRKQEEQGTGNGSAMSAELVLVLLALFLTVLGQFALQPAMEAAKAGQPTRLSFGALHGISASLFWLKIVVLLALSWRLNGRAPS